MKNCYIHIPFCEKICSYCDFCKMYYNKKFVLNYLEALDREIFDLYRGEKLETIYIGGGTPSCLSLDELEILFESLSMLERTKYCEITIECNFENTTKEKIDLLKKYRVNRISFGIESISKKNLEFLDREANIDNIKDIISYCKSVGINNINLDLMYALPGESLDDLKEDLSFILSLDVPHISTYSLIIEEHTKLGISGTKNISEDLDCEMYELICKKLSDANYKHYEISNFCKEGYQSRHNLCYWNNSCYYGFGLGASGYIDNRRYTNARSINKYIDGEYILEEEILDEYLTMEYEIILNLRKSSGISLDEFYDKYGINFNEYCLYDKLVKDGYLVLKNNHLYIPEDKWYISNEIIVKLLEGVKYE